MGGLLFDLTTTEAAPSDVIRTRKNLLTELSSFYGTNSASANALCKKGLGVISAKSDIAGRGSITFNYVMFLQKPQRLIAQGH